MQQVALKLKNWQESLDKTPGGVRRRPSHHRGDREGS